MEGFSCQMNIWRSELPLSKNRQQTDKELLNLSYVPPIQTQPKTINLPNLKARTYYYRIVLVGEKGELNTQMFIL